MKIAMSVRTPPAQTVAIIGGGPAGLMAAEVLSQAGTDLRIDVYEAMPSVARKFLQAGKGGLNLTHTEPREAFLSRYGSRRAQIAPLLQVFGPQALRDWAQGLGIETFVGSSGRVFPAAMKAAPLLRAWLHRLRLAGVNIHVRIVGAAGQIGAGDCGFPRRTAISHWMPMRWYWRSVAEAGRGWVPMAPGCRG